MTDEKALIELIHSLPEHLKAEVAKFIENLTKRKASEDSIVKPRRPKAGSIPGKFKMAPDFDAPLEEFKEYM